MGEAREEGSVCEDGSTWPFWALCSYLSETRQWKWKTLNYTNQGFLLLNKFKLLSILTSNDYNKLLLRKWTQALSSFKKCPILDFVNY